MTATTTLTTPAALDTPAIHPPANHPPAIHPPASARATTKQIRRTGLAAGVAAGAATSATAAIASAFDVSLRVSGNAIPVLGFAQVTFVAAIIGTVMAVVTAHRATRPRRMFVRTTLVLTALSIIPDVTADAHTSTRLVLALTHVVAAAIMIPALAARLAD